MMFAMQRFCGDRFLLAVHLYLSAVKRFCSAPTAISEPYDSGNKYQKLLSMIVPTEPYNSGSKYPKSLPIIPPTEPYDTGIEYPKSPAAIPPTEPKEHFKKAWRAYILSGEAMESGTSTFHGSCRLPG